MLQALGFPFYVVVLRCTLFTRARTLALQRKLERMDVRMVAQEHVALARSLLELYNHHQSDPAWLEKSMAAFAADCEVVDAASGTTFHGPEGYQRFLLLSTEHFPAFRAELSTVCATEDHVPHEGTWWRTNAGPLSLPEASLPVRGHAGGVLVCTVLQIRQGKIVSLHCSCDLTTLLDQLGFHAATAQAMECPLKPASRLHRQGGPGEDDLSVAVELCGERSPSEASPLQQGGPCQPFVERAEKKRHREGERDDVRQ